MLLTIHAGAQREREAMAIRRRFSSSPAIWSYIVL
jgi:hypothetical protein